MVIHPFLRRVLVAMLASVLVLTGISVGVLSASNELFRFEAAVETDSDVLWGPAFGQMTAAYKLNRTLHKQPDILVLGSSRAAQFRAEMAPGANLYVGGGATSSFAAMEAFLSELYREFVPKLVILSIDPWWFDPQRGTGGCESEGGTCISFSYRNLVANMFAALSDSDFLKTLVSENIHYDQDPVSRRKPLGFRAALDGEGFRPDGSYQYGKYFLDKDPYYDLNGFGYRNQFAHYIGQARAHKGRFGYAGPILTERLYQLRAVLALNLKNGVETVILLPPFAHALYAALMTDDKQRAFVQGVERAVANVAAEAGVEFHNFHDLATLGVSDAQTFDAIHADEVAYTMLMNTVLQNGEALARYIDERALGSLAEHVRNPEERTQFHLIAR